MVVEWTSGIDSMAHEWELWKPLSDRLRSSFETQPIEDCVSHPAEEIVQQSAVALGKIEPNHLLGWLVEEGGEFAASVITCLGRCNVPDASMGLGHELSLDQSSLLSSSMFIDDDEEPAKEPGWSTGTISWRTALVGAALESPDVRVRDSAVQAVENWSSEALLVAFDTHDEPEPWLREYIVGVRDDLSK